MAGPGRLLAAAALVLAFAGAPRAATDIRINPVPPQVRPQWTPVPNAPGVYWAPNLPTDVFRHGTRYYFYWEGYLFQGTRPSGPWKIVSEPPGWFSEIDPIYFKAMKTGPPSGKLTQGRKPRGEPLRYHQIWRQWGCAVPCRRPWR
jgi:hypothetical protein